MANAAQDNNGVPTLLATSQADGITPVKVRVNPLNNRLKVSDGTTGSNASPNSIAPRDQNARVAMLAVSSADGVTPVAVYIDASNLLLIKST